jgi:hypothetical protein
MDPAVLCFTNTHMQRDTAIAGRPSPGARPKACMDDADALLAKINALSVVIRALVERRDYLNLALAANQMVALQSKFEALELKLKK